MIYDASISANFDVGEGVQLQSLTLLVAGATGGPLGVPRRGGGSLLHLHVRGVLHYFLDLLNHLHEKEREREIKRRGVSAGKASSLRDLPSLTCSAVRSGSSLRQETMMECMSSCSLSSSSSHGSSAALL